MKTFRFTVIMLMAITAISSETAPGLSHAQRTLGAEAEIAGGQMKDKMGLFPAADIQWQEGPASLQKGARMAILEGDPTQAGQFTMRLWFPDGFRVDPHWHSQVEHVTIISGVLNFGMGEKFDRTSTRAMTAGSFGYWPVGMKHFAWTKGETVLQLHGMGPWTVTYVNPADDPRLPRSKQTKDLGALEPLYSGSVKSGYRSTDALPLQNGKSFGATL